MKTSTKLLIGVMVLILLFLSACARYAVVTNETGEELGNVSAVSQQNTTQTAEQNKAPEIVIERENATTVAAGEETPAENRTSPVVEENVTAEAEEQVVSEENVTVEAEEQVASEENVTMEAEEQVASEENVTIEEVTAPVEQPEKKPSEEVKVLKYTENDFVDLGSRISVSDPDGDEVIINFSAPLDENGQWQTERGDAGTYPVIITASDGKTTVTRKVILDIEPLNYPPEISNVSDMTVKEGDTIVLSPVVTDRDNDTVRVTYSGWMNTPVYHTNYEDAGVHNVTIRASDGIDTVSKQITITVKDVNRPPVLLIE